MAARLVTVPAVPTKTASRRQAVEFLPQEAGEPARGDVPYGIQLTGIGRVRLEEPFGQLHHPQPGAGRGEDPWPIGQEELGAPTADVQHDQTIGGCRQSGADPQEGEPPLLRPGDDRDLDPGVASGARQERGTIDGLTQGAGADGTDDGRALSLGRLAKAPEGVERAPDRGRLQYLVGKQPLAQAGDLLIGQQGSVGGPAYAVRHQQPYRIGTDVYDRDTHGLIDDWIDDCGLSIGRHAAPPSPNRQSPFVNRQFLGPAWR